jgi:predicted DNA-binding protein YlxM (UPF0122 family)
MSHDKINMPVVAPGNSVGRPEKYLTHVLPRLAEIEEWLKEGYTDYSIADSLGISQTTLIEYKKECPEIIEVYQRARTSRNALVMNKMYQKASGIKEKLLKQKVTKEGEVVNITEEVYIPPDVQAADLFLRNNDPEYKGPKNIESGNITINNFSQDDWQTKRKQLLQEIMRLEMQSAVDLEPVSDD